jgi:hypothetical protein
LEEDVNNMIIVATAKSLQYNYVDINEKSNFSVSAQSKNSTAGDCVIYSDLLNILK